jgi:hypothetical protein
LSHYLAESDKSNITEIIALANEMPAPKDLSTMTPAQAMCIGFIKGMSAKVESHEEKE